MRVRQFRKTEHYVYITNDQGKSSIITPIGAFNKSTIGSAKVVEMCNQKLQLRHYLDSKNSIISTFQQDYVIDAIKQIGFSVEFEGVQSENVESKALESTLNVLSVRSNIEKFGYDSEFLAELKMKCDETNEKFIKPEMKDADFYLKTQIHFRLLGLGIKTSEQVDKFKILSIDRQVYHIMHFEDARLVRQMFDGFPSKELLIGDGF